uniref:Uncharacterized protein n=1 Tax=Rhizophora mucronata TaxID=61149 RepID=A0A2P2IM18_RHIMU
MLKTPNAIANLSLWPSGNLTFIASSAWPF